jgi:hypothetical protein
MTIPPKRLPLLLLLVAACLVGPAQAADDEHVALVKNVTGSIKVLRQGSSVEARPGTTLQVSDKLASGPGASAGIVFKDGTLLTLGPATELQLRDYAFKPKDAKYAFSVYLAKGSAIYSSGKLAKLAPEAVRIDTPTATVGVRGTRFIVQAE